MDHPGVAGGGNPPTAHVNVYGEIAGNRWRTWLLIGLFVGLVALLAYVLGAVAVGGNAGFFILPFALAISGGSALVSYCAGDKVVLGMPQAHEVSAQQEPQLHHVIEELAIGAGIPKPRVYVIDDSAPNAFAAGRDPAHPSVAVTRGLVDKLDRNELQGVLAHELSHVRNFDIRVMLIVAVLLGMAALLSDWIFRTMFWGGGRGRDRDRGGNAILLVIGLVLAILTPIIAQLIQLAVRKVGAIANPFRGNDHERPGEAVDRRGVGGSKPGEHGPGLVGGFAVIAGFPQSLPCLVEFEALDDGRVGPRRPPAEVPGQVLHQVVTDAVHQLRGAFRLVIDRAHHQNGRIHYGTE